MVAGMPIYYANLVPKGVCICFEPLKKTLPCSYALYSGVNRQSRNPQKIIKQDITSILLDNCRHLLCGCHIVIGFEFTCDLIYGEISPELLDVAV